MAYRKIFVDSDILLDVLLRREPFNKFGQILLQQALERNIDLYSSTLIFANIHYMLAKNFNKQIAKEQLNVLSRIVKALAFDADSLNKALNSDSIDFEDTVQYFVAKDNQCDLIVSRNLKHYKKFDIPVLTAEQFLQTL